MSKENKEKRVRIGILGRLKLNKFGGRIFFASLALFSLLLLSILIFVYYPSGELIIAQEIKGFRIVMSEVKNSLNITMQDAIKLSQLIYYNPKTFEVINTNDSDTQSDSSKQNERRIVDDFLFSIVSFDDNILLVTLKTNDFTHYAYRPVSTLRYSVEERLNTNSGILAKIREADGKAVVIDHHDMPDFVTDRKIASVGRLIKNTENNQEIGTILIDIDIEPIFKNFFQNKIEGDFLILNSANKLVLSTREIDAMLFEKMLIASDTNQNAENNGEKYVVLKDSFPQMDWKMIYFVKRDTVLGPYYKIRNGTITTIFILFIIIAIVSILYSKRLTSRFENLLTGMKNFREGNLDIILHDTSTDELSAAISGFNEMSNEIKTLIQKVYLTQLKQKDAEKEVLKNQINPHFIYNSLESIQMFSIINDQKEIANMVASLGKLLQTGLTQTNDIVDVEEELEFIRMYLNMQKIRYHEKFSYNIKYTRNVAHKKILKFIIQPLVENAVVHGLENKVGPGTIIVNAKMLENMIALSIEDDGIGMSKRELYKLRESINRTNITSQSSIGIRNVCERIKLYYGEESRFYINSTLGKGTRIDIKLTLITETESAK